MSDGTDAGQIKSAPQEDPKPLGDAEIRDEFNEVYRQLGEMRAVVNDLARAIAMHEHSANSGRALYPEMTLGRPRGGLEAGASQLGVNAQRKP